MSVRDKLVFVIRNARLEIKIYKFQIIASCDQSYKQRVNPTLDNVANDHISCDENVKMLFPRMTKVPMPGIEPGPPG